MQNLIDPFDLLVDLSLQPLAVGQGRRRPGAEIFLLFGAKALDLMKEFLRGHLGTR